MSVKIVLLLQSLCYLNKNADLKETALRVIEKNANASLVDVTSELEAHMYVCTSLKMLENPTNKSEAVNLIHTKPRQ